MVKVYNEGMLKKALSLIVCVLFAGSVCGCYIGSGAKYRRKEHRTALKVFEYIQDEDIDSLVELFSEDAADRHDLEQEWEDFFDAVDGDIESYDRLQISVSEERVDRGEITRIHLQVRFRDVTTDEGAEYDELVYMTYPVHSDSDYLGITVLELISDDDEIVVGGYTGN